MNLENRTWNIMNNIPIETLVHVRGKLKTQKQNFWYGYAKAYRIRTGPKSGGLDWRDDKGKKIDLTVGWWAPILDEERLAWMTKKA